MDIDENTRRYLVDIVEKAKKWDTWDDIVKDLTPYLNDVFDRIKNHDKSIIKDFYILKLLSYTKIFEEFSKLEQRLKESSVADNVSYGHVFYDILKLHSNKDKLDAVLEAQTQLLDHDKRMIRGEWKLQDDPQAKLDNLVRKKNREEWRKQHNIETKEDDENFVVEDSQMEHYFKAKCVELANITAKIEENGERRLKMRQFLWLMIHAETLIRRQWIFERASTSEHRQCLKQIKDMWPDASFEDSMWPDAYGVDIVASSKDTIVSE